MHALRQIVRLGRSRTGLTQQQLAQQAEIHVDTVVKIESGHRRHPRNLTLGKIARVLDLDLEELLELADQDGSA